MSGKCALVMAGGTGGHIFPASPWPRRCARSPGGSTGSAPVRTAWRAAWFRRRASPSRRSIFPACAARGRRRWCCCRCGCSGVLAKHPGRAPRAARRGDRPGRLHHFSRRDDERAGRQAAGAARAELGRRHGQQGARRGRGSRLQRVSARDEEGELVGNPLRPVFLQQPGPQERLGARTGPLLLVGKPRAKALNDVVPQALALIPRDKRPQVRTRAARSRSMHCAPTMRRPAEARMTAFIDDMAQASRTPT